LSSPSRSRRRNPLAKGDIASEVGRLKAQNSGADIIVFGGATFVSSLLEHGLIDELHLFMHPVAIGNALRIFSKKTRLGLVSSTAYSCAIVVSTYRPM
jgi:dihydrofolate reductase